MREDMAWLLTAWSGRWGRRRVIDQAGGAVAGQSANQRSVLEAGRWGISGGLPS